MPTDTYPHILITNDDGVHAPGLAALAEALAAIARVTVIAPDHNWSAAGHAKTMHKPLRADPGQLANGLPALVTTGAPSDAIALGLLGLADGPVDLVVAGINRGENLSHDVTYSGTVTAAMEGAVSGIPAIAVSLGTRDRRADYSVAAAFAVKVAQRVLATGLPPKTLLNINVPELPAEAIQGVRITRLGARVYRDVLVYREDPFERPYYWIGGEPPTGIREDGTDVSALAQGYISITPLQLDLTAYSLLETLAELDW